MVSDSVYGFSIANTPTFRGYGWDVLTTSAWRTDPELVQLAQQHGAQVELNAGDVLRHMSSNRTREAWVHAKLVELVQYGASGINFDLEMPMQSTSKEAADYVALVKLTAEALHRALPGSTVSVDVPWSPHDVDGRNYDWLGLAEAADLLFVMAYDIQSQILGRCIANANSPFDAVSKGMRQWLDLGVPAHKLVLGLPWYGYDYTCEGQEVPADVDICTIKPVSFRNVSCSDAAGAQRCYSEIMATSPYFNYRASDGSVHQVWFDNPQSLALKYQLAADLGIKGIGFWNLDCLDYGSSDVLSRNQTNEMWQAVRHAVAAFVTKALLNTFQLPKVNMAKAAATKKAAPKAKAPSKKPATKKAAPKAVKGAPEAEVAVEVVAAPAPAKKTPKAKTPAKKPTPAKKSAKKDKTPKVKKTPLKKAGTKTPKSAAKKTPKSAAKKTPKAKTPKA
eukprot:gene10253-10411_t